MPVNKPALYLGIMSGTSLDGVDCALTAFDRQGTPRQVAGRTYPMPAAIKTAVLHLCTAPAITLSELGQTDRQLADLFADCALKLLKETGTKASEVRAIGSHGQTIWHEPDSAQPFTLQIGDAHRIAALTGIDTIADFRRKDMAFGGQGAPLVPAFHRQLIAGGETAVILNIGGIANISVIREDAPTLGFDTGPGNMLMDAWNFTHTGTPYDQDAAFARQGTVHAALLQTLLDEPYFLRNYPKSTGRELFSPSWLAGKLAPFSDLQPADVQRTLLALTAQTIAKELAPFAAPNVRLILCGGGSRNPLLVETLADLLPDWQLEHSESLGIDADYMEAIAFAWLAWRHVNALAGNLPEATGAARPAILGSYHPAG